MTVYVDTSALLRLILREPGALTMLQSADALVSSEMLVVEGRRTLDRLRLQGALSADEAHARVKALADWHEAIDLVLVRAPVLNRASDPFPTPLGTLDAIHLATALVWRERVGPLPVVATHDEALAAAARAFAFEVVGA